MNVVTPAKLRLASIATLLLTLSYTDVSLSAINGRPGLSRLPTCEQACGSSASCSTECEYGTEFGWVFTTCGEYNGGAMEDQCDGTPFYSCSYECGTDRSSSQSCIFEEQSTTCGVYGMSNTCGDGICGLEESCSSCSTDCSGSCPDPNETESNAWGDASITVQQNNYDETIHGGTQALNVYAAAGLVPYDDYAIDWADSGEPYGMTQCCDGWTPAPDPDSVAPSQDLEQANDTDDGGILVPLLLEKVHPNWLIGWYDCNMKEQRLGWLRTSNKWLQRSIVALGVAATKVSGSNRVAGIGVAGGLLAEASIQLGETISNIEKLQCFPNFT